MGFYFAMPSFEEGYFMRPASPCRRHLIPDWVSGAAPYHSLQLLFILEYSDCAQRPRQGKSISVPNFPRIHQLFVSRWVAAFLVKCFRISSPL